MGAPDHYVTGIDDLHNLSPEKLRDTLSRLERRESLQGFVCGSGVRELRAWINREWAAVRQHTAGAFSAAVRLLNVYTNGLPDERCKKACCVLDSDLTVDEELWGIDELVPIPPAVSLARRWAKCWALVRRPFKTQVGIRRNARCERMRRLTSEKTVSGSVVECTSGTERTTTINLATGCHKVAAPHELDIYSPHGARPCGFPYAR